MGTARGSRGSSNETNDQGGTEGPWCIPFRSLVTFLQLEHRLDTCSEARRVDRYNHRLSKILFHGFRKIDGIVKKRTCIVQRRHTILLLPNFGIIVSTKYRMETRLASPSAQAHDGYAPPDCTTWRVRRIDDVALRRSSPTSSFQHPPTIDFDLAHRPALSKWR